MEYQIIFSLTGFWFKRLNERETYLAYIYEWAVGLGFIEIRKWRKANVKNKR